MLVVELINLLQLKHLTLIYINLVMGALTPRDVISGHYVCMAALSAQCCTVEYK